MPLPSSGALSLSAINTEFGRGLNLNAYRGTTYYTSSAGPFTFSSGAISFNNFYGTQLNSSSFSFTISANQTNANLRSLAVAAGWNQSSQVIATINGGVYISSNGTGTPALTVNGSFPNGVSLVNNGLIIGMGGNGGQGSGGSGGVQFAGSTGTSGGLALAVSVAISITNNGTIGGGGGGGGGGNGRYFTTNDGKGVITYYNASGGGGGGGRSSVAANSSGGAAGASGYQTGSAGAAGTSSSAGNGGGGGGGLGGGAGGNGGGWGSTGSTGATGTYAISSGGPYSGGSGGGAVSGNGNITWVAFGTRLGGIS
jgi:hypothetical protein